MSNPTHEMARELAEFIEAQSEVERSPFSGMEVYFQEKGQVSFKQPPGTPGGPRYFNIKVSESR
jgi:hypothetical protein